MQAFPFFGVERRGAPVLAHTRIGEGQIRLATSVRYPDAIIVMDPTLVRPGSPIFASLRAGGDVLVNTVRPPRELQLAVDGHLASVDAVSVAIRHGLGSRANPIVNTVILGAFAKLTHVVELSSLEEAIRQKVPSHTDANIAAAREAYGLVEAA